MNQRAIVSHTPAREIESTPAHLMCSDIDIIQAGLSPSALEIEDPGAYHHEGLFTSALCVNRRHPLARTSRTRSTSGVCAFTPLFPR